MRRCTQDLQAGLIWLGLFHALWLQPAGLISQSLGLGEGFEAAVVGSFDIVGEATGGQLPGRQMIA
jgi:hypothetical protein